MEATEFTLSCLEPMHTELNFPPITTRDFIDSLESMDAPPTDFKGPTLEEFLDADATHPFGRPCITLAPCPKRVAHVLSSSAALSHRPAPSTTLTQFHAPLAVDYSLFSKGKEKMVHVVADFTPVLDPLSTPKKHTALTNNAFASLPLGNSAHALTLHCIALAFPPRTILPHTPTYSNIMATDGFWQSKGKRKLSEVVDVEPPTAGKKNLSFLLVLLNRLY